MWWQAIWMICEKFNAKFGKRFGNVKMEIEMRRDAMHACALCSLSEVLNFQNCLFDLGAYLCVFVRSRLAYFDSTEMMSTQISWMPNTAHTLDVPFWRWCLLFRQSSSFWFATQQIQFRWAFFPPSPSYTLHMCLINKIEIQFHYFYLEMSSFAWGEKRRIENW